MQNAWQLTRTSYVQSEVCVYMDIERPKQALGWPKTKEKMKWKTSVLVYECFGNDDDFYRSRIWGSSHEKCTLDQADQKCFVLNGTIRKDWLINYTVLHFFMSYANCFPGSTSGAKFASLLLKIFHENFTGCWAWLTSKLWVGSLIFLDVRGSLLHRWLVSKRSNFFRSEFHL